MKALFGMFSFRHNLHCPLSVPIISEHLSVSMHAGTILLKDKSSQQFNDN